MPEQVRFALSAGPIGPLHMAVHSFRGREGISRLYAFDIEVSTTVPEMVFERAVLGTRAVFALRVAEKRRYVHGVISSVRTVGTRHHSGHHVTQYTLRLVPRAWFLTKKKGSRIFQDQRVDQVITAVLGGTNVAHRWNLREEYPEREYCTQFEETDYEFVRRLCAENGILFYLQQPPSLLDSALQTFLDATAQAEPSPVADIASLLASAAATEFGLGETLVFTNEAQYPPITDGGLLDAAAALGAPLEISTQVAGLDLGLSAAAPALPIRDAGALSGGDEDFVTEFSLRRAIRTTAAVYREFDPERPLTLLQAQRHVAPQRGGAVEPGAVLNLSADRPPGVAVRGFDEALDAALEPQDLERYEHDGNDLFPDWERAKEEPKLILEQARRRARVGRGRSVSTRVEAGHRFELEHHSVDALNAEYVVTSVRHQGRSTFGGPDEGPAYANTFECVPVSVPFVPKRPRRRNVQVCLTAIVAGPAGEEIHVNEVGAIKVKFHWDRGGGSTDPTCWIRTMHAWGGAGWGFQFIPRIGMEVVVVFEGGDPDKPLVTGCVYNGVLPTPFHLPRHKTRSGIRTKSTPGKEGHNELSFEDAANEEQIYLHAERDWDSIVERDRTAKVQRDDRTIIQHDQDLLVNHQQATEVVGERRVTLRADDIQRVDGTRHVSIGHDLNEQITGQRSTHVTQRDRREVGADSHAVIHGDMIGEVRGSAAMIVGRHDEKRSATIVVEGTTQISGTDVIDIVSDKEVLLRCGSSSIRISAGEIEILSAKVTVRGKDARLLLDDGEAKLKVKTAAQIVSDDKIVFKASGASIGLASEAKMDGSKVLLNSPEQASDDIQVSEPNPTKIELVDDDGNPIPYQRFRIQLDEGGEYTGFLDENGKAEVDIEGSGQITFPDLVDVEQA